MYKKRYTISCYFYALFHLEYITISLYNNLIKKNRTKQKIHKRWRLLIMTTKANVYEMVTSRIIAELEKGNIP